MSASVTEGLLGLSRYAEVIGDSDKAERIRAKHAEVQKFLQEEGLNHIPYAEKAITLFRSERAEARATAVESHLAAVAEEALRIEDDHLVHKSRVSVTRAIRARQQEGTADPSPRKR